MPRRLAAELAHETGVIHAQVRIAPDLHSLIRVAAASRGQSVQRWMLDALRGAVLWQAAPAGGDDKTLAAALDGAAALDAARGEGV